MRHTSVTHGPATPHRREPTDLAAAKRYAATQKPGTAGLAVQLGDAPLPANPEMERETIAAILCGDEVFCGIMFAGLEPADFLDPLYSAMFVELRRGWERGVPFWNTGALLQWMKAEKIHEAVRRRAGVGDAEGWHDFLVVLQRDELYRSPTKGDAPYYLRTLQRLRMLREALLWLGDAANELRKLDEDNGEPGQWFEKVSGRFEELRRRAAEGPANCEARFEKPG